MCLRRCLKWIWCSNFKISVLLFIFESCNSSLPRYNYLIKGQNAHVYYIVCIVYNYRRRDLKQPQQNRRFRRAPCWGDYFNLLAVFMKMRSKGSFAISSSESLIRFFFKQSNLISISLKYLLYECQLKETWKYRQWIIFNIKNILCELCFIALLCHYFHFFVNSQFNGNFFF